MVGASGGEEKEKNKGWYGIEKREIKCLCDD
jgi:hypothetical protein